MKKNTLTILLLTLIASVVSAQTFNNANSYQVQQEKIIELEKKINEQDSLFRIKFSKMENQLSSIKRTYDELNAEIEKNNSSFSKKIDDNKTIINNTKNELSTKIDETNDSISSNSNKLKSNTTKGAIALIATLLVSILTVLFFHKKSQKLSDDKIAALKEQADELNEKIVNQFSNEMDDLQKIGNAIKNVSNVITTDGPDHTLVKALADRITFMEMTLYRMDSSVRGHKQLSKSISQMKDNLLANGYELVDMLGKEYNDGMKVTAYFNEDENIERGKQIITSIIKPQIMYKGIMIQSAQITVSQNI